jgi:hypothetical protein
MLPNVYPISPEEPVKISRLAFFEIRTPAVVIVLGV